MLARSPHDLEPARPLARYITGSPLRPRLHCRLCSKLHAPRRGICEMEIAMSLDWTSRTLPVAARPPGRGGSLRQDRVAPTSLPRVRRKTHGAQGRPVYPASTRIPRELHGSLWSCSPLHGALCGASTLARVLAHAVLPSLLAPAPQGGVAAAHGDAWWRTAVHGRSSAPPP